MNLQVLVSTMNQNDHSIIEKMNIQSDVIIINQCEKNEILELGYKDYKINFLSFSERGIGLSRNNALMRATADICLFADDDVKYVDNYRKVIIRAFEESPKADVIIFNVPSKNQSRINYQIEKVKRVRWFNCLRYGTYRVAVRTEKLKQANVFFSLLFGGGAKYSSGEDSLFLAECIRKGLRIYAHPTIIGYVSHKESTWFNGYTDKYFIDKGVFYACLSKRWARALCLQHVIRHRNMFKTEKSCYEALLLMNRGVKSIEH